MKEKGMSKGEFRSVAEVNGGIENMVNWDGKDKDTLALIKYIADEDKLEKILENPSVIRTPVVRNGNSPHWGISRRCGRNGSNKRQIGAGWEWLICSCSEHN